MENIQLNRRAFLKGAGTAAVLGGTVAALAACAPNTQSQDPVDAPDADVPATVITPDEILSYDIVIVGAGGSGMAAAVQASELGAHVVCIESMPQAGGNQLGVEGCFGVNSRMQKAENIEVDTSESVRMELVSSQYRASGQGILDMVQNSGENIDWLIDNGVAFDRVIEYWGGGPVFHVFSSGFGGESYVDPLVAKAIENGVEFLYETKGESLVTDGSGAVTGIIATDSNGSILQINASSVILATGGFAQNEEYMSEIGLPPEKMIHLGYPGHDGVGHKMAADIGAKSIIPSTALQGDLIVPGLPWHFDGGKISSAIGFAAPNAIWINENAERFINEDFNLSNMFAGIAPLRNNKENFVLMDSDILNTFLAGGEGDSSTPLIQLESDAAAQLQTGLDTGVILRADSFAALADTIDLDPVTLQNTLDRYNEFCENSFDSDFGKAAVLLQPFKTAPYYAFRIITGVMVTCGSLQTDRSFRVVDENLNPIKGLYAVGVEGSMLWCNIYTIDVSGSSCANTVNSGRVAARDAVANL